MSPGFFRAVSNWLGINEAERCGEKHLGAEIERDEKCEIRAEERDAV